MAKKKTEIKRALTAHEWLEVTTLYLKGESVNAICKKFDKTDITPTKIKYRMKKDGITWRKENIATEVKDKICEEIIDDKVQTVKRIVKLYNDSLDVISDIIQNYKNEAMLNPAKPRATAYNMDQLSGALNKCHNGLKLALGIEDGKESNDNSPKIFTVEGIDTKDI